MKTQGITISSSCPLPEHPNPYFERTSYLCLNGLWDFMKNKREEEPSSYEKKILVPFAVETEASLIKEAVEKDDYLHYHREIHVPSSFNKGRVFLHFEAVDQTCDVYLNGEYLGHHEGGYDAFYFECENIREDNDLYVRVKDDTDSPIYPRGKQMNKRGGIWYTPTSGIYMTVWLESTPKEYIRKVKITPDYESKSIQIDADFAGDFSSGSIELLYRGKTLINAPMDASLSSRLDISSCFYPWSMENPNLYELKIRINEDIVSSQTAVKKVGSLMHEGHKVFALNDEPTFLHGLLDQGYYPESGLTPPSEEAMERDLRNVKKLGFNMLRKHIKIEPMRWYALCDKLGIFVIQDTVSGGSAYNPLLIMAAPFLNLRFGDAGEKAYRRFGRGNPDSRAFFEKHLEEIVERLYNVPCIGIYTLFNEGWGQFDAVRLTEKLRSLDPTRLIDSTSGWYDQGCGDFSSRHVYFRKAKMKHDGNRILSLSEFGGYGHFIKEHSWNVKSFGYKNFKDFDSLNQGIERLYRMEIIPLIEKEGLSIAVYTQLTDVEDEINGLYTYDREIEKVDAAMMQALSKELRFHD